MNLKAVLLLKLICCGVPLLALTLSSVGLSGLVTMLIDAPWSYLGLVSAFAPVLLWRLGCRLRRRTGTPTVRLTTERLIG